MDMGSVSGCCSGKAITNFAVITNSNDDILDLSMVGTFSVKFCHSNGLGNIGTMERKRGNSKMALGLLRVPNSSGVYTVLATRDS